MDILAWRKATEAFRQQKDAFFKHDEHSPLPPRARPKFEGLHYFEPDPRYRFEATLRPEQRVELRIPRTGGDEVLYARVGHFALKFPDGPIKLAAYTGEGHGDELFVPFKDATAPKQTYGGGRYLEALPLGEGRYELDFNRAYNPFCFYNESYSCPFPPPENWLKVPVPVGERIKA